MSEAFIQEIQSTIQAQYAALESAAFTAHEKSRNYEDESLQKLFKLSWWQKERREADCEERKRVKNEEYAQEKTQRSIEAEREIHCAVHLAEKDGFRRSVEYYIQQGKVKAKREAREEKEWMVAAREDIGRSDQGDSGGDQGRGDSVVIDIREW